MTTQGYNFDKGGTRRIISATRYVESLARVQEGQTGGDPTRYEGTRFVVNSIITPSSTNYFICCQCSILDTDDNPTDAEYVVFTRPDVNVDDQIIAFRAYTGVLLADVPVVWMQPTADQPGIFRVYLTQSGGSNGTSSAFPTYTYNVFIDAAKTKQISSTVAIQFHRLLKTPVTAATKGMACYVSGALQLWQADEYFDSNTCS